ncbi:hypothetical protein NQ317_019803 [Molorchus minor]|uniref:acid phosphatase n=1 Tax=Molorchus minor TaxID=1323400 RepID=A0ABQ9JBA5_9CUCU|nr:hypothetical protein NQ317_019803 [Molorchus minor]
MYYKIIVLIIVTPVLGGVFNVAEEDSELKSVIVLYRHGDRAPTKLYPKDPYNNASLYWPEGLGELTNVGLQHQFELGKWLRKRYSNFLPETFSPNNIYVQSTDKDRTLMSAAVNLAGLYPPTNTEVWNKNIVWRPIPIHTVPEGDDAVLAMKKACPKYDLLYEELLNSTFFRIVDEKNRQLYEYLSEKTGWNITTIRQIETIYSTLLIEQQYNLTLPPWTIGIFPKKAGISDGPEPRNLFIYQPIS